MTSKIHYACDGKARPFPAIVTAGQDGDSPQFIPVLERVRVRRSRGGAPRSRPTAVAADMAYGSRENRAYLRRRKIKAVIPEKADYQANRLRKGRKGGRPISFDAQEYKRRNLIERCNQKLKSWRGIATRYDKLPAMFEGGIALVSTRIWLQSLCPG
ncbi:IS5 family transposase [Actinocrinis puniceicyclus]|uniref:IS5 family transposase n=1 Tax=Actinocrinis puniceicyclus TaxID=977794 RepID=UPI003F68A083